VLGMSRRTIHTGIRELEQMGNDDPENHATPQRRRQENAPARRRSTADHRAQAAAEVGLCKRFSMYTALAVRPMRRVRWTDLKPMQLAQRLLERGIEVSRNTAALCLIRPAFVAGHCVKN